MLLVKSNIRAASGTDEQSNYSSTAAPSIAPPVGLAKALDAYEQFRDAIRKPLVVLLENDCLLFNDGTDSGFRYPIGKIDPQRPLWDLVSQPWFSEQHLMAATPLVRWELDHRAKEEMREADRERGFA